jgi:hypothetical protein
MLIGGGVTACVLFLGTGWQWLAEMRKAAVRSQRPKQPWEIECEKI